MNKGFIFIVVVLSLAFLFSYLYFFNHNGFSNAISIFKTKSNQINNIPLLPQLERGNSKAILSPDEVPTGYKIFLSGNESMIFENPKLVNNKNGSITVTLDIKSLEARTIETCAKPSLTDETIPCAEKDIKTIIYNVPTTLDVKDSPTAITSSAQIPINTSKDTKISYTFSDTKEYIKIGTNSIVILSTSNYNSVDENITQEQGFAHLNISTETPYDSLFAYLPFDVNDTKPTNQTYDFGMNNNDATVIGGAIWNASGLYNGSYSFDGQNDYLRFDNKLGTFGSQRTNNFTISFWIKPNTATSIQHIVGVIDNSATGKNALSLKINADSLNALSAGRFRFSVGSNDSSPKYLTGAINSNLLTPNVWHQVTLVVYVSKGVATDSYAKVYIDNVSRAISYSLQTGLRNMSDFQYTPLVGALNNQGTVSQYFNGTIDEFMLFNTSITEAQINDIYQNNSKRFAITGNQTFNSVDVSSGSLNENRLNISINQTLTPFNSNLSFAVNNGTWYDISSGRFDGYNFSGSPTQVNITFKYNAGNDTTNPFMSPLIIGNISLVSWFEGVIEDDTSPPYFTVEPPNFESDNITQFTYQVQASDNVAIDGYFINDTRFTMTRATGLLENNTLLVPSLYYLNISLNDTSNNWLSKEVYLNVSAFVPQSEVNVADINKFIESGNLTEITDGGTNIINFALNSDGFDRYWFMFNITDNTDGQPVTFNIINANLPTYFFYDTRQVVYSYDNGATWNRITDFSYSSPTYTFTHSFSNANGVLVAAGFPYLYSTLQTYLTQKDTLDTVTVENYGTSTYGRTLSLVTITNFTVPIGNKKTIWVITGQHSSETEGMRVTQGMIDYLTNETNTTSQYMRNNYIYKVIPMMNPDAVFDGHTRVDKPTSDQMNGEWSGTGINAEVIATNLTIYNYLRNNSIDLFLDVHSRWEESGNGFFNFGYVSSSYYSNLTNLKRNISARTIYDLDGEDAGAPSSTTARGSMYLRYGLFSFLLETSNNDYSYTTDSLNAQGSQTVAAINDYFLNNATDITKPTFTQSLQNFTLAENQTFIYMINATDDRRLDTFTVNDSTRYSINSSGYLRNITTQHYGYLYLNITINDTSNNLNSGIIFLNITPVTDTKYPIFTNLVISPPNATQYQLGQNYTFNTTLQFTNGTVGLEFAGTNYSTQNISFVFNKTIQNLKAGTYSYYFWGYGNGTEVLYGTSGNQSYTVSKQVASLDLTSSPSFTVTYPTETTVTGINCPSVLTCSLTRDAGAVSNPDVQTLDPGSYVYNYSSAGNENYSATSIANTLFITTEEDTTPPYFVQPLLSQNYIYNTAFSYQVYGADLIGLANYTVNDTTHFKIGLTSGLLENNGVNGVGLYNLNISLRDNSNNEASSTMSVLVTQAAVSLSISISPSSTVNNGTETTVTGSGCNSQLSCSLFRDSVGVSNPDIQTLEVGSYVYVYNTSGNQNYTIRTTTSTLTISTTSLSFKSVCQDKTELSELPCEVITPILYCSTPANVSDMNNLSVSTMVTMNLKSTDVYDFVFPYNYSGSFMMTLCNNVTNLMTIGNFSSDYNDKWFWFYVFILGIAIGLFIFGFNKQDNILTLLSGFLFIAFAITFISVGYPALTNATLKNSIILITLGIGMYITAMSSLELVRGE